MQKLRALWRRFCEFCGYTASYRAMKKELAGAVDTLDPTEILAMPTWIRGPTPTFPMEAKLAKWTH